MLASVYTLPPDKLVKAIQLARIRNVIEFGSTAWVFLLLIAALRLRWIARLRECTARITSPPYLGGIIFFAAFLGCFTIALLPFEVWGHHTSLLYGLSVQSWPSWFWDWTKSLLLTLIVGVPLLLFMFFIVHRAQRTWWFWLWVISIPLQFLTVFLVPYVVDPLFNHFEPLSRSDPALVSQLERVVAKSGMAISPSRIFLMDASAKVTGLNAYVTGFGSSKRVVVWDTTVQKAGSDEILYIFGHELGHYVLNHILKGLVFSTLFLFFAMFLGYRTARWLLRRYGAAWHIATLDDWAAIGIFAVVFIVFGFFSEPIVNSFSRMEEHQADIYGQEVVHDIVADPQKTAVEDFQKLGENALAVPDPNPLVVFWTYSHPSISERLAFASRYDPWRPGGHPRYFSK